MEAPHHRKIELQSTADLSYLYANILALSRQKLDLHFPPSAANESDPMKERVRELVDEVSSHTFFLLFTLIQLLTCSINLSHSSSL